MGQFAAVCWSKSVSEVNGAGGSASNDSGVGRWFLGALSGDSDQNDKWKVQLKLSGRPVVVKIDTGADITAISKSTFDSLPNQPKLHPSKVMHWAVYNSSETLQQEVPSQSFCN